MELPVYNTSDYYAPWNWVDRKLKCECLIWRGFPLSSKSHSASSWYLKSCTSTSGKLGMAARGKQVVPSWLIWEGSLALEIPHKLRKRTVHPPPPTRPLHLFSWTSTNKTQQFSMSNGLLGNRLMRLYSQNQRRKPAAMCLPWSAFNGAMALKRKQPTPWSYSP